jgi:hypothetical protein
VSFPEPKLGLVIRYAYLWQREAATGRRSARKDRPCAIVVATATDEGRKIVAVLPITHTPPEQAVDGIEIPAVTKKRLGLDDGRSWIMTNELNVFAWPGPDLRPARNGEPQSVLVGALPPNLFARVRDSYLKNVGRGRLAKVPRTE